MPGLVQIVTTVATLEDALSLARAAVGARLAACVQVLGPITSVYRWEGDVREKEEFLCLLKGPAGSAEPLMSFVRTAHPYDTPELTGITSDLVDPAYLAWATEVTGPAARQESGPPPAKE
jgi:periplasmic divalent cation tolerance protein